MLETKDGRVRSEKQGISLCAELGGVIVSSCVRKTIPVMQYSGGLGTKPENHRGGDLWIIRI